MGRESSMAVVNGGQERTIVGNFHGYSTNRGHAVYFGGEIVPLLKPNAQEPAALATKHERRVRNRSSGKLPSPPCHEFSPPRSGPPSWTRFTTRPPQTSPRFPASHCGLSRQPALSFLLCILGTLLHQLTPFVIPSFKENLGSPYCNVFLSK